jgi:pyruvate/2-oxoglutarate dehydrogenase complex dihydrolipoamide acyltransferase (E2) component
VDEDGTLQVRPIAVVRLAVDHRLINGRAAAQYVSKVKEILESGRVG